MSHRDRVICVHALIVLLFACACMCVVLLFVELYMLSFSDCMFVVA